MYVLPQSRVINAVLLKLAFNLLYDLRVSKHLSLKIPPKKIDEIYMFYSISIVEKLQNKLKNIYISSIFLGGIFNFKMF